MAGFLGIANVAPPEAVDIASLTTNNVKPMRLRAPELNELLPYHPLPPTSPWEILHIIEQDLSEGVSNRQFGRKPEMKMYVKETLQRLFYMAKLTKSEMKAMTTVVSHLGIVQLAELVPSEYIAFIKPQSLISFIAQMNLVAIESFFQAMMKLRTSVPHYDEVALRSKWPKASFKDWLNLNREFLTIVFEGKFLQEPSPSFGAAMIYQLLRFDLIVRDVVEGLESEVYIDLPVVIELLALMELLPGEIPMMDISKVTELFAIRVRSLDMTMVPTCFKPAVIGASILEGSGVRADKSLRLLAGLLPGGALVKGGHHLCGDFDLLSELAESSLIRDVAALHDGFRSYKRILGIDRTFTFTDFINLAPKLKTAVKKQTNKLVEDVINRDRRVTKTECSENMEDHCQIIPKDRVMDVFTSEYPTVSTWEEVYRTDEFFAIAATEHPLIDFITVT